MQIAEKIFNERKRLGWSQEQLAEHMEVSRQAVSKWESGQSLPDLDKLVLMSQIFGVSTDYLLKEDISFPENVASTSTTENNTPIENDSSIEDNFQNKDSFPQNPQELAQNTPQNTKAARILRTEEIQEYRTVCFKASKAVALGVTLCIVGVILNLVMKGSTAYLYSLDTIALLLCVAPAVILFITSGMKLDNYNYLKKEPFQILESSRKQLKEEYEKYSHTFMIRITTGVVLCIIAVTAYLIVEAIEKRRQEFIPENPIQTVHYDIGEIPTIVLLCFVAIAVYLFVSSGMRKEYYEVLLQQNGFAETRKRNRNEKKPLLAAVSGTYWGLITAGFLAYSFITGDWGRSWIVWPVAGCVFGAISTILVFYTDKTQK